MYKMTIHSRVVITIPESYAYDVNISSPLTTIENDMAKHITEALFDREGKRRDYIIVSVKNAISGFANSYRSLRGAFVLAMLSNRRLRIDWDDYYSLMDTPFEDLRWRGEFDISSWTVVDNQYIKRKMPPNETIIQHFITQGGNYTFANGFAITSLIFKERDMASELESYGFHCEGNASQNCIEKIMNSFMYRPRDDMNTVIHFYSKFFINKVAIGLQVRTGGFLANTYEIKTFLKERHFQLFTNALDSYVSETRVNTSRVVIFIASDSNRALKYFKEHYEATYPVIYCENYFARGHSASRKEYNEFYYDSMKLAIVDIALLSKCDYLIRTPHSSFGGLAYSLGQMNFTIVTPLSVCYTCTIFPFR